MKNRLMAILLAALLVGLVVLIVTGAAQAAIVMPVLYAAWLAKVLYQSIPQALLWIVLLIVATYSAVRGVRLAEPPAPAAPAQSAPRTTVGDWTRLLWRAQRSDYARWALAQRLGYLTSDVLAPTDRGRARPLWQMLDDGSLDLPDEVQAFLRAGTAASSGAARPRRRWIWRGLRRWPPWQRVPDPLALDPAIVVQLLEERVRE